MPLLCSPAEAPRGMRMKEGRPSHLYVNIASPRRLKADITCLFKAAETEEYNVKCIIPA